MVGTESPEADDVAGHSWKRWSPLWPLSGPCRSPVRDLKVLEPGQGGDLKQARPAASPRPRAGNLVVHFPSSLVKQFPCS